jgi:hypothetical protein
MWKPQARAQELYESLRGSDARADKNLVALRSGVLVPPVELQSSDVYRAATAGSATTSIRNLVPGSETPQPLARIVFVVDALLGGALFVTVWWIPVTRDRQPCIRSKRGKMRRMAIVTYALVPGAFDLSRGSLWRGYGTVALGSFPLLVGLIHAWVWLSSDASNASRLPYPGWHTAINMPGLFRAFPFPAPSGVMEGAGNISFYYWTFFWAYPYARIFWSLVALAAVTSLGLHAWRVKAILALWRRLGEGLDSAV